MANKLNKEDIIENLRIIDDILDFYGYERVDLVMVGGSSLILKDIVNIVTKDIDVVITYMNPESE